MFPNAACVVSLVDRLLHNSEIVAIEGDSYRLKEAHDRTEQRATAPRRQIMSTPPDRPQLPEHLRPLTVEIPRSWTPEEALAVFELIDDLRDKIWNLYNLQLQDLLRQQCVPRREVGDDTTLDHRPA